MTNDNAGAQLNDHERADVLQKAWRLQNEQNYLGIVSLLGGVRSEDLLAEPTLGFLYARALWRTGKGDEGLALLRLMSVRCESQINNRLFRDRLNLEAGLLLERGDVDQAETIWLQTLEAADSVEDEWILACVYANLGVICDIRCQWQQAIVHYQRSMASFQRIGDSRRLAGSHHNIAMTHRQLGSFSAAEDHFERAAYLLRRYGSDDEVARCETERALLMNCVGRYEFAEMLGQRALRDFKNLADERNEGEALRVLGIVAQDTGGYLRALSYLRRALKLSRSTNNSLLQAEVLEELAVAQLKRGQPRLARPLGEAANRLYASYSAARCARLIERMKSLGVRKVKQDL